MHLGNVKRALLQLQIQLEILGRVEIYLITCILDFSSAENDSRAISAISANLPY